MAFTIADFSPGSPCCKDLILKALSGNSALSAKKIHEKVRDNFQAEVSYQAVHKALGPLVEAKILKKFQNEYYLNPEWVNYLHSFVEDLKEKNIIDAKKTNEELGKPDYTLKLMMKPIRFVPFYLGPKKFSVRMPKECKILNREKEKISFLWHKNRYIWYNTGVCVQVIKEKENSRNIIDFLLERRRKHHKLLNLKSKPTKDIVKLVKHLNPRAKPCLSYVMSIHAVDCLDNTPYFDNMLRLIAEPGFLGIHDNPKLEVSEQQIVSAHKKLSTLDRTELQLPSVYEITTNRDGKIFASWSNVVFSSEPSNLNNLSNQLIELETELQHLWFYFHTLKNDLRRKLKTSEKNSLNELCRKQIEGVNLWNEFENLDAGEDSLTQQLKEALIKTSRIEKVYQELQNLFSFCGLKTESKS